MADGEHAGVDAVQVALRQEPMDDARGDPQGSQLPARDDAALARGERSDPASVGFGTHVVPEATVAGGSPLGL
jgi:hypothetical protein